MPRVEIVQKHNTAARRLYIRGHNGKIYPYLVMNDACLTESRREERVLQLLRLLNPCLEKRKETTKRHLFFTGRLGFLCVAISSLTKQVSHQGKWQRPSSFIFLPSVCLTHTISIGFQALFPLLSSPCGLPPARCLPTLHLCT